MIYLPVIDMIPLSKSLFQYRSEDSVFKLEINICASLGCFISSSGIELNSNLPQPEREFINSQLRLVCGFSHGNGNSVCSGSSSHFLILFLRGDRMADYVVSHSQSQAAWQEKRKPAKLPCLSLGITHLSAR